MIPKELKFKSVQEPKEGNFYYIFFGNGLMVRAYYKGGDWKLPNTLMKELGAVVLPTFMVYKNGKLSWKKEGIATLEELKSALTQ
jgi:hypothetical protein